MFKTFVRQFTPEFLLLCSATLVSFTPIHAATIAWEGQTWTINGTGATATVDPAGDLVLAKGSADADIRVTRILPGVNTSFINQHGTPEINVSYIDPGAPYNVDIFITGSGSLNPRLQAGSLFSFQGLGYARFGSPAQETVVFADVDPRVSGDAHSISVGKRQDATIDYIFDGQTFTSTYLKDNVGPFEFNTVLLRLRGGPAGGSVKFTSLSYNDSHTIPAEIPEPGTLMSCFGGLGLFFLWRKRQ
jgi:hypothetical protein